MPNKTALEILQEYQPVSTVVVPFQLGEYKGSFTFKPTVQEHNEFVNTSSTQKTSAVAATTNYLIRICEKEQQETLALFLKKVPGGIDHMIGKVIEKFMPELETDFLEESIN